jgi:hypothetical protein
MASRPPSDSPKITWNKTPHLYIEQAKQRALLTLHEDKPKLTRLEQAFRTRLLELMNQ